MEPVFTQGCME